jgi:ribosomal protein S18 acetylase RimI-like enzyme
MAAFASIDWSIATVTGFTWRRQDWCFRRAVEADVPALVALVNSAYRGESSRQGWTTEADLLDGQRTDRAEVGGLIAGPGSEIMLLTRRGSEESELDGCFSLQCEADAAAELGMFVIRPGMQGVGLGRQCLRFARRYLGLVHGHRQLRMLVIDQRKELISYYQRLGFRETGRSQPFPDDPRFGLPKVQGLQFKELQLTW